MCLSFFKIQNLCQFLAKSEFSQKDIHRAFSNLYPSVLRSCQHHLKAKFRMYFAQASFCIFEWCETFICGFSRQNICSVFHFAAFSCQILSLEQKGAEFCKNSIQNSDWNPGPQTSRLRLLSSRATFHLSSGCQINCTAWIVWKVEQGES